MTHLGFAAQLDIGRVISRTFSSVGANFLTFIMLALVLSGIPSALIDYAWTMMAPGLLNSMDPGTAYSTAIWMRLGLTILMSIPAYIVIGAITHGTLVHLNGGRAGFGECLATGLRTFLPLLGLGLLTTLGFGLFFLAFIIPGLMAMVRWNVSAPALVAERIGIFEAFTRSGDLTRDNRWRIFWLLVVWGILSYLIQFAGAYAAQALAQALVPSLGEAVVWPYYALTAVYTGLVSMITATAAAALYVELRTNKEGATSDQLAKVFE